MNINKRNALLELLSDPDQEIFKTVYKELISEGEDLLPELELLLNRSDDETFRKKIRNLILEIRQNAAIHQILNWSVTTDHNLLDACNIINRFNENNTSNPDIESIIELLCQDIWLEMNEYLTGFEKIKVINKILFDYYFFSHTDSYASKYYYLNHLIDFKQGHSSILALFYLIICQRVDLPVYGVCLPNNLILAYMDEYMPDNSVLFYINPGKKGAFLNKKEIDYFLYQHNLTPKSSFYHPCSNIDMVKAYVRSIIMSYEKAGQNRNAKLFNKIFKILHQKTTE